MPVILTLPTDSPNAYTDGIRIYKRVSAVSIPLLATVLVGTPTYTDNAGLLGDEYHCTYYSSSLDVESLPSAIYRVQTPWEQSMGVILELDVDSDNPDVDQIVVYRRRFNGTIAARLAILPAGTQFYTDPDGQPGDEYHSTFMDSSTLAESQPSESVIADAGAGTVVVTGFTMDLRDTIAQLGPGDYDPMSPGPRVHVELIWTKPHILPSANGRAVVRTSYDVQIQRDGRWNIPLIANDLYTVSDTYYEFTFSDGHKYFKRVLTANGAAQNFSLLGDVKPLELR